MSIRFQCEKEIFYPLAAQIDSYANNKGISLHGYQEDVYQQMEIIYTILKREAHASEEDVSMDEVMDRMLAEDCLFELSWKDGGIFHIAGYLCSFLLEYGLRPVLVFDQQQLAVGVWLYEDYDMETVFVESPDFSEEAYDMGGSMLAISCESLLNQYSFSEAVKYGCQIMRNFVCAYDIARANQQMEKPVVLFQNQEPAVVFEKDGDCPYFNQLLELYNQVVQTDEKAISIMSREVQNGRWVSYFFVKKAEPIPLPKECLDKQMFHISELDDGMLRQISVMQQAQLVLAKTTHKDQTCVAAELLLQNLQTSIKTTLVLGTEEQLLNTIEIFKKFELEDFILSEWQMDTDTLYNRVRQCLSKKPKQLDAKKIEMRKKRYHDVLKVLEQYKTDLDTTIVHGMTLRKMLHRWAYLKKCPYELNLQDKAFMQTQALELIHVYTDAMEQCQHKDTKGNVCVDFTVYSSGEITQFIKLLNECEKRYKLLWDILPRFEEKLGKIQIDKKSQKQYMDCLSDCADIFVNCEKLKMWKQKSEQLSVSDELTDEEKEAYHAFNNFKKRKAAAKVLSEYWAVDDFYLSDGQKRELCSCCDTAINEMNVLTARVTNRVYNSAIENIEYILSSAADAGERILQKLSRKKKCQVLENLAVYFEHAQDDSMDSFYQFMEALFQEEDVKNKSIVFIYEKMIAEGLQHIQKGVSSDVFDMIKLYVQDYVSGDDTKNDQERERREALEKLAVDVATYADGYSEAVKNVFRHFGIEYHEFGRKHAGESMIHYIREWRELLEKKGMYRKWESARYKLKNQMAPVYEQLSNLEQEPKILCEAFEKAWYRNYMERYQDKIQKYEMNRSSAESLSEQLSQYQLAKFHNELFSKILQKVHGDQEQNSEEQNCLWQLEHLRDLDHDSNVFLHAGNLLQTCFPILFMTPETALEQLKDTEKCFDQILLCGSQSVPYYKLLYLSTKTNALLMISEDKAEQGSVAEQAQKMGFPQISIYRR